MTVVKVTIGYSDSIFLPKKDLLKLKNFEYCNSRFRDTFSNARGCHCDRTLLYSRIESNHTTALNTSPQLAHRKAKKKRKSEKARDSKIDTSSSEEEEEDGLKEAAVSAEMFR